MNYSQFTPAIGNMFLVLLFAQALVHPVGNKSFVDNTSSIYFMTELFSLAACLVLLKFKLHPEELGIVVTTTTSYDRLVNKLRYFSVIVFFIIGTLFIGYATHEWFIPLLFSLSLLSKAYSIQFVSQEKKITLYAILFGISYVSFFISPIMWGILYYGSLAIFELYNSYTYIKKLQMKSKRV